MKGLWITVLIAGFVCFAGGCNSSFERVDPQRIADLEARDARGDASIAEVLLLARLLIEADRSEDSLARVDRLITTDLVEEAERQNVRGLALEQLVRLGDAYDAYEAALAAVSDYPPTLVRKAAFHYRSGDLERSRLLAARAVSLSPGAAEGWYYLYLLALTPSDQQQALLGLIAPTRFRPGRCVRSARGEIEQQVNIRGQNTHSILALSLYANRTVLRVA